MFKIDLKALGLSRTLSDLCMLSRTVHDPIVVSNQRLPWLELEPRRRRACLQQLLLCFIIKSAFFNRKSGFLISNSGFFNRKSGFFY